ncbi:MAG: carbamoyltransferase HypF [Candidatus Thorarchaeota archaeon]
MKKRATIHVTGIVQGVGFRPFIYRIAKSLSLTGYVLNLGDAGVRVIVEGNDEEIRELINRIENEPPSISRIDTLDVDWENPSNSFTSFAIHKSTIARTEGSIPVLPPDIAICNDCIEDLTNSDSRWYLYPFTSCAACGPRFSTITDLPYDRPNTTMVDFPLCDTCNTGYTTPLDRRYHAQTTACEKCGPIYQLVDSLGKNIEVSNPVLRVSNLVEKGNIVAVQGIAGTHIVTKTTDAEPLETLRRRKKRSQRPFAIMVRNLSIIKEIVQITSKEETLLTSWKRPIVLLQRKEKSNSSVIPEDVLEFIAPGLDTIGVMLPYAPVHHLLFRYTKEPSLVMTSANPTGVPMYIDPKVIVSELKDIVDYSLVHNRRVFQRADDSVIKFVGQNKPVFIRRARGYVPEPLQFREPKSVRVVGVGPEEKVTGAILKSGMIYPTQHIGDINRVESLDFLSDAMKHILHLLDVSNLDGVACDLHPEFLTTEFAEQMSNEFSIPLFRVQHHHAHLASMVVDHKLPYNTSIVCITADGYGFNQDGKGWGGEVLLGGLKDFRKMGGLKNIDYPGGDLSAVYAARSVVGILKSYLGNSLEKDDILRIIGPALIGLDTKMSTDTLDILIDSLDRRISIMSSTSAGRFLDAVAMILGVSSVNSYDGECPMKLEALAKTTELQIKPRFMKTKGGLNLDTSRGLMDILELKEKGVNEHEIAYAAQWYLGSSLAYIACRVAKENQIQHVGFSGGVALNSVITKAVIDHVVQEKLTPLIHKDVPPGDGGISIGQVAVAAANLNDP